jgi:hypothetical protein
LFCSLALVFFSCKQSDEISVRENKILLNEVPKPDQSPERLFEFGFVSEEIKNDREYFERYTGSYQLDPSNQVRFAGSLFRKNRNFIITDMTYDAKLQSAIINLSNNEVKVLSKRVDSQFIKFLKPPAIFNEDNELVYLYDPETFQDFPSDSSSPIFNAINEYAEKFSEDDIYYLLVLKLKM